MKTHTLEPKEGTLHGHYRPDQPPALVIESGDRIVAKTLDIGWGMGQHDRLRKTRLKFEPRPQGHEDGPALLGPIAVTSARPGQILAVHIEEIRPVRWGWTYAAGGGPFLQGYLQALGVEGDPCLLLWEIDPDAMTGISEEGFPVRLRPFLGMLGLSPATQGPHSGWSIRRCGGNLDCREAVAGTTLFLPIETEGALLSFGDGHAAQGDGEVAGSAIECPMERVVLRLEVLNSLSIPIGPPSFATNARLQASQLRGPWLETPAGWYSLGFGSTLQDASQIALAGFLDAFQNALTIGRSKALALASPLLDLRITQIVNGVVGVHAFLPR